MDGPGTMTWEEFVADAEELERLSAQISDRWQFLGDKKLPGQAYLQRQEKLFVSVDYPIDDFCSENEEHIDLESEERWSKKLNDETDPFEVSCDNERPLIVEHHVLWSMSYSVPVIYFNAWKSDFPGMNPVSVEVAQRLRQDKLGYSELSQAVHPLLGRPFLHIHPCGSRHILQSMSTSVNGLVSWLSAVAPAILGLRLSPEYFRLTLTKERASAEK